MMLAGTVGRGHFLVRRLRTLTFGLLTPFHFIRAGSFVSVTALLGAPLVFSSLFGAKMVSRLAGLLPVVRAFGHARKKGTYDSVMMSTGSPLRYHLRAVRPQSQPHQPGAVLAPGRGGHRERRGSHRHRQRARYLPVHLLPEEERRLRESACGEPEGEDG